MKLSLDNDTNNLGDSSATVTRKTPGWVLTGFWISIAIALAAVVRRLVALAHPSQGGPPQMTGLDNVFASHAALTLAHIVPAMLFVLVTPLVLVRRNPPLWAERLLFPLGAVVGLTAYAMSVYAVGGWIERSAVLTFNTLFLYSLGRAYVFSRAGERAITRRWMIQAIAILLGIATTRPVMAVFFATRQITHLEPAQFFGIAFWVGFSLNTIAVMLWQRFKGRQSQSERMAAQSAVSL